MTFNWWTFLFQAINFVVLAYVLHRLLYRPLREAVEKRRKAVASIQQEAEQTRRDAEILQKRLEGELAELDQQRQQAMREAKAEAAADREKLLAETEELARQRREAARQAIEQERDEALKALRGDVIEQGLAVARRILAEAADQSLQKQLAGRLVEAIQNLSSDECEHLRAYWQPDDGALLETAEELDGATLGTVTEAVTAILGRPVTLAVHAQPTLLSGVRLRIGGHVWDASLAGQLQGNNGKLLAEKQS